MSEKGKESQQDRYVRIQKQGLKAFDAEMHQHQLPEPMIKLMHKHCDRYWGCCAIQEQMMEILMDVANFTLGEANAARKVVAKKQMSKIPELRTQVYDKINNPIAADYIWEVAVAPQLGYAFSLNHSLPYSFVGIQSILLASHFNPIYWNTACLIVNSGSLEDHSEEEIVDIFAPEGQDLSEGVTFQDLPDRSGKIRKTSATDYGKIAKAIGDIQSVGIEVSSVNINKSKFGFAPDVENNRILFGLKGLTGVGDEIIKAIIDNRPYSSPKDFIAKVKPTKSAMIPLIKGGAFDDMVDRKFLMAWYIWETCDKKSNLTLQNMPTLIKYGLIPTDTSERQTAKRVYEFNRYLKAICKSSKDANNYYLDTRAMDFLVEIDAESLITDESTISVKDWDKKYQKWMDTFRDWMTNNKEAILKELNTIIFQEAWDKYAKGTISAWEMEVLCFYYHDHELKNVNTAKYGISNFFALPEEPEVEKEFRTKNSVVNIYKLTKICGTCIAKNKIKGEVSLLTNTGVVTVKMGKDYFAMFDKQISERNASGEKKIVERSWFKRGSMIMVQGMRSGDVFMCKNYKSTGGHQLYKIEKIEPNGDIELRHQRHQGDYEDDEGI